MAYSIAVVGATGNVGSQILKILDEKDFPVKKIVALASRKSIGKNVSFGEKILKVIAVDDFDFKGIDIGLFSPGAAASSIYAPKAAKAGCVVIDNTSCFRMDKDVPLIVPEVNADSLGRFKNKNIIANPNCAAIQLAVAAKPIHDLFNIKKIVVSTYQSVSGAGKAAMDELYSQTKGMFSYQKVKPATFQKQIAFNAIPQIGNFLEDKFSDEEDKIRNEIKKIVDSSIDVIPTCVRIPVFIGHAESVYLECEQEIDLSKLKAKLQKSPGVRFMNETYSTPAEIAGEDEVFVSRLRKIDTNPRALSFWVVADNLRKGAALNAVQIAEKLIKNYTINNSN